MFVLAILSTCLTLLLTSGLYLSAYVLMAWILQQMAHATVDTSYRLKALTTPTKLAQQPAATAGYWTGHIVAHINTLIALGTLMTLVTKAPPELVDFQSFMLAARYSILCSSTVIATYAAQAFGVYYALYVAVWVLRVTWDALILQQAAPPNDTQAHL
ncbi:hypothetical protein LTR85_004463 [Meristemomyces frigidus]|nr:hypothetical protein LTR85_004463 [Meristemomyces frigidus]